MGDASFVRLPIGEEATFGDADSVTSWRYMRYTGEDLRLDRGVTQSAEINPTRQPAGSIPTSKSTSGGFSTELSLVAPVASPGNGYDMLIEGACLSDWSTIIALVGRSITISAVVGGTFTLTDSLTAAAFVDVVQGQWIQLSGFTTNGTIYAHVKTKSSSNVLLCEGVRAAGAAVTAEVGGATISVRGSYIRIATTKKSYSIEREYSDLTVPEYSLYTGQWVGTWERTISPDAIVTERWGFRGKTQATLAGTSIAIPAGPPAAVWATPRINAIDDIAWIMEGSYEAITSDCVTRVGHNLDNQPRIDLCIGEDGPGSVGVGNPRLNGNFNTFMKTGALLRKHESRTFSKVAYLVDDGTRRQMVSMKNILYTNVSAPAGGNDRPVEVSAEYSAESDVDGISMQIDRY